jgi:hypothetical protein
MRSRITTFNPDINIIICCSFCGYETRTTRAWRHSHAKFQCSGCGETISLTRWTALDALAFGLSDVWRRLRCLVYPAPLLFRGHYGNMPREMRFRVPALRQTVP